MFDGVELTGSTPPKSTGVLGIRVFGATHRLFDTVQDVLPMQMSLRAER
jgi:hypothetical protein